MPEIIICMSLSSDPGAYERTAHKLLEHCCYLAMYPGHLVDSTDMVRSCDYSFKHNHMHMMRSSKYTHDSVIRASDSIRKSNTLNAMEPKCFVAVFHAKGWAGCLTDCNVVFTIIVHQ